MGNCTGASRTDDLNDQNTRLMIKTSTWMRDSHELFDYESPQLLKKTFKVQHPSGFVREENDITVLTDRDIYNLNFNDESWVESQFKMKPFFHVAQFKGSYPICGHMHHPQSHNGVGYYSVFDQPHIFDQRKGKPMIVTCLASGSNDKQADSKTRTDSNSQDEDQDSNKLWLIVRYMTVDNKTNEFKLTGGETIKIGRVKFTVREVHTQQDENQTDYDSFENNFLGEENIAQEVPLPEREDFQSFDNQDQEADEEVKEGLQMRLQRANGTERRLLDEEFKDELEFDRQPECRRSLKADGCPMRTIAELGLIDNPLEDLMLSEKSEEGENLHDESLSSLKDQEELSKTMNTNHHSESLNLCRICFSEQTNLENPLISPCKCSGSLKYIHLECLRTWLSRKENVKTNNYVTSYSWKAFHCELCKSEYDDKISVNEQKYWLFEISKPKNNYVILESAQIQGAQNNQAHQSKTLHVINLNQKQIIKIGRGHDNDLRIADISVSRCHSFLKKDAKGNVIIEDNQSKFGTLVQVKAPLILYESLTYYIQAGRTIMKLQVAPEWNLLGGLMKANFNKKYELDDDKNTPNITSTGDQFYDCVGKFCNSDALKLFYQAANQGKEQGRDGEMIENSGDNSCGNIPEEQEEKDLRVTNMSKLNPLDKLSQIHQQSPPQSKIGVQEIKTHPIKIKLTSLKQYYTNDRAQTTKMSAMCGVPNDWSQLNWNEEALSAKNGEDFANIRMGFNNMKSLSDHNLDRLQLENFDEDDTVQINIPNTVTPSKDQSHKESAQSINKQKSQRKQYHEETKATPAQESQSLEQYLSCISSPSNKKRGSMIMQDQDKQSEVRNRLSFGSRAKKNKASSKQIGPKVAKASQSSKTTQKKHQAGPIKALTEQNVPPVIRISPENEADRSPMVPKSSNLHQKKRSDIRQDKESSFNYKF